MNIVARWSIVAGVLGMLVVGGACSSSSHSPNPQGLGGSGDPEVDAGVTDDDAGDDPADSQSPSIVDSGDPKPDGGDPPDPNDADPGADPDAAPTSACVSCMQANCADERTACHADTTCACWANCSDRGALGECMKDCAAPNQVTISHQQCRDRSCLSECSAKFDAGLPDGGLLDGGFAGLDGGFPGADGGKDTRTCDQCVADSCSSQSAGCKSNSNCSCWSGCFNGNNWVECTEKCGAGSSGWFDLLGCRMSQCQQCR